MQRDGYFKVYSGEETDVPPVWLTVKHLMLGVFLVAECVLYVCLNHPLRGYTRTHFAKGTPRCYLTEPLLVLH